MKMGHPLWRQIATAGLPEMPAGGRLLAYRSPSGSSALRRRAPLASVASRVPRLPSFSVHRKIEKAEAIPVQLRILSTGNAASSKFLASAKTTSRSEWGQAQPTCGLLLLATHFVRRLISVGS